MELGGETYGGRSYVVGSEKEKLIQSMGIKSDQELEYEKYNNSASAIRKIFNDSTNVFLNKIYDDIKLSAKQGESYLKFGLGNGVYDDNFVLSVISTLKSNEYDVEWYKGNNAWYGYNYLIIKW